jgi:hypothetical protein
MRVEEKAWTDVCAKRTKGRADERKAVEVVMVAFCIEMRLLWMKCNCFFGVVMKTDLILYEHCPRTQNVALMTGLVSTGLIGCQDDVKVDATSS